MKKIVFFVFAIISSLLAQKTDIYFGNGILTIEIDAIANKNLLKYEIKNYLGFKKYNKQINKISYAYNQTEGMIRDLLESAYQKIEFAQENFLSESDLADFKYLATNKKYDLIKKYLKKEMSENLDSDIAKQIAQYKNSLTNGNKVLVVAHSQGNLYAIRASKIVNNQNFHVIHIASPDANYVSNDIVGWDNDLVTYLSFIQDISLVESLKKAKGAFKGTIECNVRAVIMQVAKHTHTEYYDKFAYKEHIDQSYEWFSIKKPFIEINDKVHAFTFYMGRPLKRDLPNDTATNPLSQQMPTPYVNYLDPVTGELLVDTQAKEKILAYIKVQLDKNSQNGNGNESSGNNNNSGNSNGGGDNPGGGTTDQSSFDYKNICSGIDFPEPIPSELEDSINTILTSNKDNLLKDVVCPLINAAIKAYNLKNGGGLLGGGGFS